MQLLYADIYKQLNKHNVNTIVWGHNFSTEEELNNIYTYDNIKKYICVSNQQYQMLRDHSVFGKSTYIFNAIDTQLYSINKKTNVSNYKVCYIGSIVPAKGFHYLAREWSKIIRKVPEAELHVIGSGRLYDDNTEMGKYGISSKEYEEKFMKYLTDRDGNIKKNIIFHGIKGGKEKVEIMSEASVGIVNPTAKTETFGIGAIEFQALKVPVVTKAKYGHFDTVSNHKSGYLTYSRRGFRSQIINLLKNKNQQEKMGMYSREFVEDNFDIYKIIIQWDILLSNIETNPNRSGSLKDYIFQNKIWLREMNRIFKKNKFLKNAPSIIGYRDKVKKIIRLVKK
ncbi:glycosyltransferase family 4 protein, partial [Priestia megaterium]|uniref:glycosyltransferase family 4 protein n=1 Tax=Priestia megaterium TaxID=1404 RepID=UPI002FFD6F75